MRKNKQKRFRQAAVISQPVAVADTTVYSGGPGPAFSQQATTRNYVPSLPRREKLHLTGTNLRAVHDKAARLFKDVPYLRGPAVRMANYLGPVTPRPATLDAEWNKIAHDWFRRSYLEAELWDASGKYNFADWQAQLNIYADVYGDGLSVFTDNEGIPCVRLIPATAIADPPGQYGSNRIWQDGVKVGAHHRHLAWHVLREESAPVNLTEHLRDGFQIDAADGHLLARWDGVGNVRGASTFIGAGNTIIDMQMADAASHQLLNLASKIGMSIETEAGQPVVNAPIPVAGRNGYRDVASNVSTATGETAPDVRLYHEEFMSDGPAVISPGPGKRINLHNIDRDIPDLTSIRGGDYERIAMNCGLSVQMLFGIQSGIFNLTGPGFRMCLADGENWRIQRLKKIEPLVRRQYARVIEWGIRTKQIPAPKKDFRWWTCEMQYTKSYTIDEARDAKSDQLRLEMGITNRQELASNWGNDAVTVAMEQIEIIESIMNALKEKDIPLQLFFPKYKEEAKPDEEEEPAQQKPEPQKSKPDKK